MIFIEIFMLKISSRFQIQDERSEYLAEDDWNVCENKAQDRQEARIRLGGG